MYGIDSLIAVLDDVIRERELREIRDSVEWVWDDNDMMVVK